MVPGPVLEVPYPTAAPTVRAVHEPEPPAPRSPRLLDRVRIAMRARHGSRRTEKAYVGWNRRDILLSTPNIPGLRHQDRTKAARPPLSARHKRLTTPRPELSTRNTLTWRAASRLLSSSGD